jgi:hypothetical protein
VEGLAFASVVGLQHGGVAMEVSRCGDRSMTCRRASACGRCWLESGWSWTWTAARDWSRGIGPGRRRLAGLFTAAEVMSTQRILERTAAAESVVS